MRFIEPQAICTEKPNEVQPEHPSEGLKPKHMLPYTHIDVYAGQKFTFNAPSSLTGRAILLLFES